MGLNWKAWVMELIGTFALCYVGGSSVGSVLNVAFAHGAVLCFQIYAGAATSGANYNPAVTIALQVTGNLDAINALFYVLFQFLGGVQAGIALVATTITPVGDQKLPSGPGCPGGLHPIYYPLQGAIFEIVATFFLVFSVFGTAVDKRAAPGTYGLCIGGSLLMSVLGIGNIQILRF